MYSLLTISQTQAESEIFKNAGVEDVKVGDRCVFVCVAKENNEIKFKLEKL